jgi:predicted nucleic acid-binding protein
MESAELIMKDLLSPARFHNLSSYDASYLDLAMRKGLPIATLDNRLIEAATAADVKILKI